MCTTCDSYEKIPFVRSVAVALFSVTLLAAGLVSCQRPDTEGRYPNVLFVSVDTTRRDHCSAYGYSLDTTPRLHTLGDQGALFEMAYAPTATTAPSHATMLTGYYPLAHRVVKNGLALRDEIETLPELLRPYGFQTAAVVSAFVLDSKFGLAQGFDKYDDEIPPEETAWKKDDFIGHRVPRGVDRRSDFTTSRAIQWLRTDRDPARPFFLFVHYFAPHYPYVPPSDIAPHFVPAGARRNSFEQRVGLYDAEIAFADAEIGRLIDELQDLEIEADTIVVVTADHGEGLNQHGWMFHGVHIYEEAVRVPLILRFRQRIPAGQVFEEPVEIVDLTPTILDLVGVEFDEEAFQGKNLGPALRGQAKLDPRRPVFLQRRHFNGDYRGTYWVKGELFGIRDGPWKYVEGKEENLRQLFNLDHDPWERTNLIDESPDVARRLAQKLNAWMDRSRNALPVLNQMSEEDIEKLRALGYVQ